MNLPIPTLPELEAIPVRDQNEALSGGDFTASGTPHVDIARGQKMNKSKYMSDCTHFIPRERRRTQYEIVWQSY